MHALSRPLITVFSSGAGRMVMSMCIIHKVTLGRILRKLMLNRAILIHLFSSTFSKLLSIKDVLIHLHCLSPLSTDTHSCLLHSHLSVLTILQPICVIIKTVDRASKVIKRLKVTWRNISKYWKMFRWRGKWVGEITERQQSDISFITATFSNHQNDRPSEFSVDAEKHW